MTPAERRAERTVARQRQATKQATREAQRRFGRAVCRTALARETQRLGPRVTCDYESAPPGGAECGECNHYLW